MIPNLPTLRILPRIVAIVLSIAFVALVVGAFALVVLGGVLEQWVMSIFGDNQAVARSVAENLLEEIGGVLREIEVRTSAGNAAAYRFFSRADRALSDAQSTADTGRRRVHFRSADSLANLASREDSRWIEPVTLRSEIALRRRGLEADPSAQLAWLDSAAALTRQALALDRARRLAG